MRVIVYHTEYGCDTGCCGHAVEMEGKYRFHFEHPGYGEDPLEFAQAMVRREFGKEHVADLAWEDCIISDD